MQGLNLGLYDAASLAQTVLEAVEAGADLGAAQSLEARPRRLAAERGPCDSANRLLRALRSRPERELAARSATRARAA